MPTGAAVTGFATSGDGTRIAYERAGSGPPLVLVGGGLDDGSENAPLVPLRARLCTVCNYARRGRGDTPPYDLRVEIEELDAIIGELGGRAHVYGVSTGGALALEAAAAGSAIDKPVLVVTGGVPDPHMGGLQPGYFDDAADAIAARAPRARRQVLAGQSHVPDPGAVVELLVGFLAGAEVAP